MENTHNILYISSLSVCKMGNPDMVCLRFAALKTTDIQVDAIKNWSLLATAKLLAGSGDIEENPGPGR